MPHAKTLEKEANVRRVLDVALDNFYTYGIEQTKIADIAAAAGVTPMSIHRYFGDKCTLVLNAGKIFRDNLSHTISVACQQIQSSGVCGFEQVKKMLDLARDMYFEQPRLVIWVQDFQNYIRNQIDSGKLNPQDAVDYQYDSVTPLRAALDAGIKDGSIRSGIPLDTLYHSIMSLVFGAMYRLAINVHATTINNDEELSRQLGLCYDMILSYISA